MMNLRELLMASTISSSSVHNRVSVLITRCAANYNTAHNFICRGELVKYGYQDGRTPCPLWPPQTEKWATAVLHQPNPSWQECPKNRANSGQNLLIFILPLTAKIYLLNFCHDEHIY